MKFTFAIALALLLFACDDKGKTAEPNDGDKDSNKTPTAGIEPKASDKPNTLDEAKAPETDKGDDLCGCRMLTKHSLEDLENGAHQKACDGKELLSGASCEQFDMMRNCIFAAHGNKFKTKKWKSYFAKQDWYVARDDFKQSELSKLETANIRALKERAAVCRAGSGGKVTASDIKLAKSWFKNRKKNVPAHVWSEMEERLEQDRSKAVEDRLTYFEINKKTKFWYQKEPSSDGLATKLKGKKFRTIVIGNCIVCTGDEVEEELEGCDFCDTFELLVGEKNEILAVYLTVAAACPYVYVAAGDEPLRLQGEILRNLNRPSLEGRQRLALDTVCTTSIAVRLAEHKPEITLLDEVYLNVDGERFDPVSCRNDLTYCSNDERYWRLLPDDTLDLVFEVNQPHCDRVELVADGYYVPLN